MTILWYSQTGTAEDFAHRLCDEAKQYGFISEAQDVQDYNKVLTFSLHFNPFNSTHSNSNHNLLN
jgi:sulfite reductase alpha subunit-like flavoprotein